MCISEACEQSSMVGSLQFQGLKIHCPRLEQIQKLYPRGRKAAFDRCGHAFPTYAKCKGCSDPNAQHNRVEGSLGLLEPLRWKSYRSSVLSGFQPLCLIFSPCKGYPGEGPRISLASCNVNSTPKNFDCIVNLGNIHDPDVPISVILQQESRIHPFKSHTLRRKFQAESWNLTVGPQPPVERISGRRGVKAFRQKHGGLATISQDQLQLLPVDIPPDFLLQDRVQTLKGAVGDFCFYLLNCYLPSGPAVKSKREVMIGKVFEFAATLGDCPIFICGDFQCDTCASKAISTALYTGDWIDVAASVYGAKDKPIPPTFVKQRGHRLVGTRIDFVFANPAAASVISGAVHLSNSGIPDHRPVVVNLDIPDSPERLFQLKDAIMWDFPSEPQTQEEWHARAQRCQPILEKFKPALCAAAARCDAEKPWELAREATSAVLQHIAVQTHERHSWEDNLCAPKSPVKGGLPQFVLAPAVRKPRSDSTKSKRIAKVHRLFREILVKLANKPEVPTFLWKDLLAKTSKNLCSVLALLGFHFAPVVFQNVESTKQIFEEFQQTVRKQDQTFARNAISRWRKRMRISSSGDKKQVHRWIKNSFVRTPALMENKDGTLTGNISQMLEAVSTHMESIYNHHHEVNPTEMLNVFMQKYGGIVDSLSHNTDVPQLDPQMLFEQCRKKPISKASGLDQWKYRELRQLPANAWFPFMLVMLVAEAGGGWPQTIRCISLTCLPKDDSSVLKTDKFRAIGISCVIYNIWSSIRYQHLGDGLDAVAPQHLLGGLRGRNADFHEIDLSMKCHKQCPEEQLVALFLDRWKCFDLIIPQVSLGVAKRLGLPQHVFDAALSFYSNQVKFFRIGKFFGPSVLSSNAAIQGCSFSVLMIHCMYSILAKALDTQHPNVGFASFIDDAKIWAKQDFLQELHDAFVTLETFDKDVGQVLNPKKSVVLAKSKKVQKQFVKRVQRPFEIAAHVRSLGRFHSMRKASGAKLLTPKFQKASAACKRVNALPIPVEQKALNGFLAQSVKALQRNSLGTSASR